MTLFQQFGLGVKSYFKALSLVFNNGLWLYLIYPMLLYILLLLTFYGFVRYTENAIENYVLSFLNTDNPSSWFRFFTGFLHFFLSIGLKIIFFLIYSSISKYVVLVLMSPVMAILSAKTETIITGNKYPFNSKQFLSNIIRSVLLALRNMILQLSLVLLSCALVWIPFIGWLCPVLLLIISYYFYGFSMIDYVNERRKLHVSASVKYIRTNKGVAVGTGFMFSLLFNIPIVGVVFATVLAPVAGCIAVLEKENNFN